MSLPAALQSRRACLQLAGLMLLGSRAGDSAAASALASPTVLADELVLALKKNSPLLVMVSLDGCPFCKVARENYLLPLQRDENVSVVQINMRYQTLIQDFKGVSHTQDSLISSWQIKVAPTVLFFGRAGTEVAERLVGGYLPDYYGAYLDERLRVARAALQLPLAPVSAN
jgi:thioredoxin-related protein